MLYYISGHSINEYTLGMLTWVFNGVLVKLLQQELFIFFMFLLLEAQEVFLESHL